MPNDMAIVPTRKRSSRGVTWPGVNFARRAIRLARLRLPRLQLPWPRPPRGASHARACVRARARGRASRARAPRHCPTACAPQAASSHTRARARGCQPTARRVEARTRRSHGDTAPAGSQRADAVGARPTRAARRNASRVGPEGLPRTQAHLIAARRRARARAAPRRSAAAGEATLGEPTAGERHGRRRESSPRLAVARPESRSLG
jgi:hypothetical protein